MESKKVLLVDDDPNIRRIAQIVLSNIGRYEVMLACCGADAIELATQSNPDLILMDVMMPDMDGPTTLTHIRSVPSLQNTPTIFITAKVQKHEMHVYKQQGALGVITKPFDPMHLCNEIDKLLAASQVVTENMQVPCKKA
ncbi:MAG TPA: response regulator [Drouetiella sp.]|jgi:two-component system, OmpR family, response regulator